MSNIKLKPCPFCGGVARIASEGETVVFVTCQTCHVETPGISVSAEYCANDRAATQWNMRKRVSPKAHWEREDLTALQNGEVETIRNGAAVCSRCKRAFFMPEDEWCYCPNCGSVMNLMKTGEDLESLVWRKREEEKQ